MIIYQASKRQFLEHSHRDDIEDILLRQFRQVTGHGVGHPEVKAWKHSLTEMAKVLMDDSIPADAGVAIEYQLPQVSKRIDFVVVGEDADRRPKVVIVELKQWSESRRSDKDAIVWARRGGQTGEREGPHPSYQAWSYAAYLQDFNTAVRHGEIALQPCAYLHNHPRNGEIDHPHYAAHIARAPLFLERERDRLQAFIRQHVRYGDHRGTLYAIENGRIRPSKMLADSVQSLLQGRSEFVLLDEQKLVYEEVLAADSRSAEVRQVVLVRGGPGTGKSVVAINLLAALLSRRRNARYVSKNAAPRAVYEAKLAGTFTRTRISNLFTGSGAFVDTPGDTYDVLIVDEAHRLNEKSGLYRNRGEHQILEIIRAARCAVFFVDDDQQVTIHDIGHSAEITRLARQEQAQVTELELASQFRCNGSDGYLSWLDNLLEIRPTANTTLDPAEYDFRVFDDPAALHAAIRDRNMVNNRSRVVAGYCWPWPSRRDPQAWDIQIDAFGYRHRWNLSQDGSLWIITPGSIEQVGCIHTCQGLELDYVGVIIGPDLNWREGAIATDVRQRAKSDQSVKGLKKLQKTDPAVARQLADRIIKNTYRTLMTRGMKGCYVYCVDPALAGYIRSRIGPLAAANDGHAHGEAATPWQGRSPGLRRITKEERAAGIAALPLVDLKLAAGGFSEVQSVDELAAEWVAAPDWVRPQPGMFVAQVIGESMNRRIPNGAWCLFRAFPSGTREGKVVVVQHRDIADPDTGGSFTVKVYRSVKQVHADGTWQHTTITLHPHTDAPGYKPMVLELSQEQDQLRVVAEFLGVI